MTLAVVDDNNYEKLKYLYDICTSYDYKISADKYETILLNNFGPSVFNYQLPANSLLCQRIPEYTGNTILHLLSKNFCNLETLIKLGADFTIKNSNGYTPLLLAFFISNGGYIHDSLLTAHILKNNVTNIRCKNGISHFHVACSSDQVEVVKFFLESGVDVNERVNFDSPEFPGYTPLHFAVTRCRKQVIELLLQSGANWHTEDVKGISALHLLIKKRLEGHVLGVLEILRQEIRNNVFKLPDSIGLTRLHLDSVLRDPIHIQTDAIDSTIRFDSPLWPGQTPLHFALRCSYNSASSLLVKRGADLLAKDAAGTTPLDLLLMNFEADNIIDILSWDKRYGISDLKFTNGLNLLNVLKVIRRSFRKVEALENKQLEDVNTYIPLESPLWPGYNLLHLAVMFDSSYSYNIVKKLLSQNVAFLTSTRGSTSPLHLAFRLKKKPIVDVVLSYHKKIPADSVDQDNLSHLHIACVEGNNELVELLLKNEADPNLHTLQDIECYSKGKVLIRKGSTALHIAVKNLNFGLIKMLLAFEANLKATNTDGITPFQKYFDMLNWGRFSLFDSPEVFKLILESYTDQITSVLAFKLIEITLSSHPDLFKWLVSLLDREGRFKDLGLTRLQIACALGNLSMVKEELQSGTEVNHRISCDSLLWPGDTAMHILFRKSKADSRYEIAELLLDYGADPTIQNADNETVIHLLHYFTTDFHPISFLLRDKYTKTNPINNKGLSHLHICCQTGHVLIIEELLKSGANVNAQLDHFTGNFPGCTPLHIAVKKRNKTLVELLINYGADPNVKSLRGCTALHLAAIPDEILQINAETNAKVVKMFRIDAEVVEVLLRCPTIDLQAKNHIGQTVLECVIDNEIINYIILNMLLEKRLKISKNSKGFLKAIVELENKIFKKLINNVPDLTTIDPKGQNVIHHIASQDDHDFRYFRNCDHRNIEDLIYSGCEINHKDHQGKTPLHIAISSKVESVCVVKLLLDLGADVNIKDDYGQTPCVNIPNESISDLLVKHICKLELAEIFVDNSNKNLQNHHSNINLNDIIAEKKKLDVKLKEIHSSWSVKYFFSEQFVVDYRRFPAFQRQAISNFCNLSDLSWKFCELYPLIRRQFRKARSRTRLLEPAGDALRMLANAMFPELCSDLILSCLSNDDIMNLIRSENGELTFAPLPENC